MSRNGPPDPRLAGMVFNNDVYWNKPFSVQNSDCLEGDQLALFYYFDDLDHSETSMLVSADFKSHRPVNN